MTVAGSILYSQVRWGMSTAVMSAHPDLVIVEMENITQCETCDVDKTRPFVG
jgi:hypothetical protein